MDTFFTQQMLSSLSDGDYSKVIGYAIVFGFLWIEVRGLKKEIIKLNATITKSFAEGESRFTALEKHGLDFEHRLTLLENQNKGA